MAGVEPRRVAKDDPRRLAVGILSVGISGGYRGFTGQATVLGPGVAVTTKGSTNLRGDQLHLWDEGSAVMSHIPSDDAAVDGEPAFRILRFAESHAVPLFARAVLPTLGGECRLLWYDYSRNDFFELSGSVAPGHGNRFNLHLKGDAGIALDGAPVFTDQFVVGMVASGPHPDASTSTPDGTFMVEVLSVAVMAESNATQIVRDLLHRIEADSNPARSLPGKARAAASVTNPLSDEEMWERMSLSARSALERAEGIRRALKKRNVHTEYLIAGLLPSWHGFFAEAGITESELSKIVREQFGDEIPWNAPPTQLQQLPPLSKNAREVLNQAVLNAYERDSRFIRSTHLLYGALSVESSKTVQSLLQHGVRRENVRSHEDEISEKELRDADQLNDDLSEAGLRGDSGTHGAHTTGHLLNPETFARLSPSSRSALERAEGMRAAIGLKEVHMEQLLMGLFERDDGPTLQLFAGSNIDEQKLLRAIREERNTKIPSSYSPLVLNAFPPLSEHASKAVQAGVRLSIKEQTRSIENRHLLYGALSVNECGLIKGLRGVRKEDIQTGLTDGQTPQGTDRNILETVGNPTSVDSSQTSDEQLWARMGDSGRRVLERAAALRAAPQETIHMEHLVAALFDDWRRFFERNKLDARTLRQTIRRTVQTVLKMDSRPQELSRLPSLSAHVRQALRAAAAYAEDQGIKQVGSSHLLRGMLSVNDCRMVQALKDSGLELSNLRPEDASWGELSLEERLNHPQIEDGSVGLKPGESAPASTAAPTPKVDSDLWSEQDKLGYEAYARTIAALITHPETVAPLTIGIKAPWGAGKTSLMKRVQHLLDGQAYLTEENRSGGRQAGELRMTLRELLKELNWTTQEEQTGLKKKIRAATELKLPSIANPEGKPYGMPPRITVWFNAWKYQTSEQIWAGMAHCIISQVTARMTPLDRELFWLRLHARRVNADEVRRKIYDTVLRQIFPFALMMMVACGMVVWVLAASPEIPLPHVWQGLTVLSGLFGVIWKAWDKLGDKAAATVKELVREPHYEGKMGYLHLVESDIREVLSLVTAAGARAPAAELRSAGQTGEAVPTGTSIAEPTTAESSTSQPSTKEKEKPAPLVVFVDDLDRCAPNKVAEVVEAINLFLCGDYPNCIFVLGMEPGMVAAALEVANKDVVAKAKEMGFLDEAAPVGWRFMEKIVQMPVAIPPPTKHGRDAYVKSLVGSAGGANGGPAAVETAAPAAATQPKIADAPKGEPPKEEDVQAFVEQMKGATLSEVEQKSLNIVEAAPAEKRQAAAEAGKRVYAQTFSERDPMIADFVQECAELVEGNPRQIKRYVNVFRFYSTLRYGLKADGLATESELPNDRVLAKFVAMSIQWPHAMDCLRCRHATNEKGQAISRLEHLETKSAEIRGDDASGDATWKEIVGEKGMGLESWAHARAFRMFLARGESLGKSRGHGLW